jgi:hypothetical protein
VTPERLRELEAMFRRAGALWSMEVREMLLALHGLVAENDVLRAAVHDLKHDSSAYQYGRGDERRERLQRCVSHLTDEVFLVREIGGVRYQIHSTKSIVIAHGETPDGGWIEWRKE